MYYTADDFLGGFKGNVRDAIFSHISIGGERSIRKYRRLLAPAFLFGWNNIERNVYCEVLFVGRRFVIG